ncbi:MAG: 3-hydroxyacyl-CoA dehydrogenase NAD-binding domain-containing protein [Acidobacteriota bacterium]|nr:3-hydroxyacyl-CoA dehydrogenase NAD-binding domain-containing protein [Acidobacteriota bacterium]
MIRSIVVLGAGTMGHGIAYGAAMGGFDTRLYDVSEEVLGRSRSLINGIGAKAVELGKVRSNDFESARARLEFVTDLSAALSGIEMVIEAVPEKMDLKLSVFEEVERHAPADAIVASNTSALSITEISSALTRPQRVAGMHFFNPVHKMKLVEVVCALETAPETMDVIEEVAKQMGKETVRIKESPGFVTSRVNAMIGNEAFYMLQQGIASARDIDKALKLGLNHPMGPFELVDLVGLDTRLSVLEFLHAKLGEKYRPCPLLVEYVQAGRLGKKVGKGVYEY